MPKRRNILQNQTVNWSNSSLTQQRAQLLFSICHLDFGIHLNFELCNFGASVVPITLEQLSANLFEETPIMGF